MAISNMSPVGAGSSRLSRSSSIISLGNTSNYILRPVQPCCLAFCATVLSYSPSFSSSSTPSQTHSFTMAKATVLLTLLAASVAPAACGLLSLTPGHSLARSAMHSVSRRSLFWPGREFGADPWGVVLGPPPAQANLDTSTSSDSSTNVSTPADDGDQTSSSTVDSVASPVAKYAVCRFRCHTLTGVQPGCRSRSEQRSSCYRVFRSRCEHRTAHRATC